MKILVCVKQVPVSEQIIINENPEGKVLINEFPEYKMNRFDEFAVEEAIRIKQLISGSVVDVLTVGNERAGDVVKRAIGMGADHGILLHTQSDINFCPSLISEWISVYASTKNYQLILTGSMSEDSMNGQVGPMIAGSLKLPAATQVICAKISEDHSRVYVEREIEKGQRELIQICLPAVLAIQTGANHPRYPSLSNLLRANKQALEKVETDSLSEATSREKFTEFIMPRKKRAARYATGSAEDKARQVLKFFRDRALI